MANAVSYTAAVRATHEASCSFHSPEHERCYGLSRTKNRCMYNATFRRTGMLPMCNLHKHKCKSAGQCEVLELCGKPCGRAAKIGAGSVVCETHKHSKPCHFLSLPVEVRRMIYRYLFPREVPPGCHRHRGSKVKVAILKLNRQVYTEASSVLYQETVFLAKVDANRLRYLDISIWFRPVSYPPNVELPVYASRIQCVRVELSIEHDRGTHALDLVPGEFSVFAHREVMRKLVGILETSSPGEPERALRQLTVRPRMRPCEIFKLEDALACLFLSIEPLKQLHYHSSHVEGIGSMKPECPCHVQPWKHSDLSRDELDQLFKAYLDNWTDRTIPTLQAHNTPQNEIDLAARLRGNVEKVLIAADSESEEQGPHLWLRPVFANSSAMWHYLRVATENSNINLLKEIEKGVTDRWMYAWRTHIEELQDLTGTFDAMNSSHRERTIDDLTPATPTSPIPNLPPSEWLDLEDIGEIPELEDSGVELEEDVLRVRIRMDGKETVHLKTPAVIRKLALLKAGEVV